MAFGLPRYTDAEKAWRETQTHIGTDEQQWWVEYYTRWDRLLPPDEPIADRPGIDMRVADLQG